MENNINLIELLDYIDPARLDYQEWVNVGMALKNEDYDVSLWDEWSRKDFARYHVGECAKKWQSFTGAVTPVTGATIVRMAKENGWSYVRESRELDWNDEIGKRDDLVVLDKHWIEGKELHEPDEWKPEQQIITYLETLFEAGENVGYVVESWEKDGKYIPANKGCYDRTSGQLIKLLSKCNGDIGSVIGDYNPECGAWIRFNPLDGNGVKNENVTEYRYALVESDSTDIETQNAIIRELELPVAVLVYSGGKSIHAIVKIDAVNYDEYRKRVDYLYSVCQKNGLDIDKQNRNPSRLSRLPGVIRKGKKQFIIDTNIGKADFNEWKEYIESVNDDLPDPESLADKWDNMPELSPPLIDGILRQGHKMLIAGPSKAGKSYALIELCCAIAEGRSWFSFNCTKGRVMYVNLELDHASCLHRFKDVYSALGWKANNISNIDIWNLRGKSVPMDKLAPKLIRRASKKNYIAIIIDPIYKVITGDENSADQMAKFCNQFDKVCTELGCAVIYCHHHSKGIQGGKKSMDRASGSGVFARDPDALIDLIELDITDELRKSETNKAICKQCETALIKSGENIEKIASLDDLCSASAMTRIARDRLKFDAYSDYKKLVSDIEAAKKAVQSRTAWRVEGTLREFPKFEPINLWFDYPIHKFDDVGVLKDIQPESDSTWKRNFSKKKTDEQRANERKESIMTAFNACNTDGRVTVNDLAEYLGIVEKTVRIRLKEHGGFWVDNGEVGLKYDGKTR